MRKKLLPVIFSTVMITGAVGAAGCAGGGIETAQETRQNTTQSSADAVTTSVKTDANGSMKSSGEVTAFVGTSIFGGSLDPFKGSMSYGSPFVCNALLKVNPSSEYVGDLADSWEISDDALTYSFKLKQGVKFSDGSDFTAEDVVFTYQTVKDNQANNASVEAGQFSLSLTDENGATAQTVTQPCRLSIMMVTVTLSLMHLTLTRQEVTTM